MPRSGRAIRSERLTIETSELGTLQRHGGPNQNGRQVLEGCARNRRRNARLGLQIDALPRACVSA